LQIPTERWVYPYAGTDAHDTYAISERAELYRSPAIRIGGARALALAGVGIDDVDYVDLYSCFPSAVQVAAAELGLPVDDPARPLTVTGGLTFAGGPWSNYVSHSIATMAELLAANPGRYGLITANGGYLTKHSFGLYGTEPPKAEFRWEDVQSAVDREPTRDAAVEWEGVGSVEAWTTPFDRDGRPEKAFLAVRTPDDRRTLALLPDAEAAAATVADDIAGAKVAIRADGTATVVS
jgi:acetyl-CoA C-acetyltransferase